MFLSALASQAALTVTNMAAGSNARDGLFLESDGSLWAMGWNPYGGLGDGTTSNANRPEQIVAGNVTAVATGSAFTLFLKSDGSLWGMGYNAQGALGNGTFISTNRPEQILAGNVTAIAAGAGHSLFIKSDGSLWAMGENDYGELGDGTFTTNAPNGINHPEQIVASNVVAIAAGYYHSLFVKNDGSLWGMGRNDYGQLGNGTFITTNRPQQILAGGVKAVAAGRGHSLFIKSDGSLWAMGWNIAGQLGDGTYNSPINVPEQILSSNVVAIAAGFGHSLFIKGGGSLHVMGYNAQGQLGDATFNSTNLPEKIVPGNVTAISGGEGHSLFSKSDGSLWAMGDNTYGELGDGFATNGIAVPEQIFPAQQLVLGIALSSQTNLQINATCAFGGSFRLLGSTNLSLALNLWTPLLTNPVATRGPTNFSVTLTNAVTPGSRQFYILQSQ